jgi:hypothetical protein
MVFNMEAVYQNPEVLKIAKSSVESEIGTYSTKWLNFMVENRPNLVREMKANRTLFAVANSADDIAWNYCELLNRQYMELHPRPEVSFEKIVAWERTRAFNTDLELRFCSLTNAVPLYNGGHTKTFRLSHSRRISAPKFIFIKRN